MLHLIKTTDFTALFNSIHAGQIVVCYVDSYDERWLQMLSQADVLEFVNSIPCYSNLYHHDLQLKDHGRDTASSTLRFLLLDRGCSDVIGFAIINEINPLTKEAEFTLYGNSTTYPKKMLDSFMCIVQICYNFLNVHKLNFATLNKQLLNYLQRLSITFLKENYYTKIAPFSDKKITYYVGQIDLNSVTTSPVLSKIYDIDELIIQSTSSREKYLTNPFVVVGVHTTNFAFIENEALRMFVMELSTTKPYTSGASQH